MTSPHVTTLVSEFILAAKWLVRHSSMFPKQQRRPLPSLLSDLLLCGRLLLEEMAGVPGRYISLQESEHTTLKWPEAWVAEFSLVLINARCGHSQTRGHEQDHPSPCTYRKARC